MSPRARCSSAAWAGPEAGRGPQQLTNACLDKLGLVTRVEYHPADRFWTFQWIETAIFAGLAAALVGFAAWWILKRVS